MPPRLSTTHGRAREAPVAEISSVVSIESDRRSTFRLWRAVYGTEWFNVICVDLRSLADPWRVLPCCGSVGTKLFLYPLEAVTAPRLHRIIYFIIDVFDVAYFQRDFRGSIWGTTESVLALPDQLSRHFQEHISWNRLRPFPVDIPVGVLLFRRDEPRCAICPTTRSTRPTPAPMYGLTIMQIG